jgi:hypothetical protein
VDRCPDEPTAAEAFTATLTRPDPGVAVPHLPGQLDLVTASVLDADLAEVLVERGTGQAVVGGQAVTELDTAPRPAAPHHPRRRSLPSGGA